MAKGKIMQDKGREERIMMEIIADAYGPEEQAMGWYYYLEEKLQFPFTAICNQKRTISPLHVKDEIDVIGMAPEEECEKEMFVLVQWEKDGLAVPLSQLTVIKSTNKQTRPFHRGRKAIDFWAVFSTTAYRGFPYKAWKTNKNY